MLLFIGQIYFYVTFFIIKKKLLLKKFYYWSWYKVQQHIYFTFWMYSLHAEFSKIICLNKYIIVLIRIKNYSRCWVHHFRILLWCIPYNRNQRFNVLILKYWIIIVSFFRLFFILFFSLPIFVQNCINTFFNY